MSDELRERLIVQILRMSPESLQRAEKLLANALHSASPFASAPSEAKSGSESPHSKDWPHAPLHRLGDHGTYIVTAGTAQKAHMFRGQQRLDLLESALLQVLAGARRRIEAWAVFSNHYHFVACAEADARPLCEVIKQLHGKTSRELNLLDDSPGRTVWQNYWDTELTYEKSYFARLNYVHQNAVKHGLVQVACQYRWCSAAWFERTATAALVKTIYNFKTDRVRVEDDFDPV